MIYLDYHATTPCDPRVVEVMLPYFSEFYANPSSISSKTSLKVANDIEKSRSMVASLINAHPKEIFITSGATESNNLSIFGSVFSNISDRKRIITTKIEHKSVLQPIKHLEKFGYEIIYLPVTEEGLVNFDYAQKFIDKNTYLVSIQYANNEIGTIQNISALSNLAHVNGAYFHTDAAQAVGKIPINVKDYNIDFLSISSHKLYGPKGVGALFINSEINSNSLTPIILGGGQEQSLRPGTYNVPGIIGLGKACELCETMILNEFNHIKKLRDKFEKIISSSLPNIKINGCKKQRLPNNSNITFFGIDADAIIANSPDLVLSTGSACNSGALEPSYVLNEIGLSREEAYQSLRIGIGRFTTEKEILESSNIIINAIERIKSLL